MAKYFNQSIADLDGFGVSPPVAPLNGLQPMRRSRAESIIRAQDRMVATGRRVIASGGMRGSNTWFVGDTNPALVIGSHPGPNDRRLIGAGSVDLTAGNMLRCWVVCIPSGETQLLAPTRAGGASGSIEIGVVWTDQDGGTETTSSSMPLPGSTLEFGAEPANMWASLYEFDSGIIEPPGVNAPEEQRRWSNTANVQVLIYAVGGARPVDVCVFEQPSRIAMEADDTGETWSSHVWAPGSPGGPGEPPTFPVEANLSAGPDGDPRGGVHHIMDVHHGMHQRLGPVLFSWCGARESDGSEGVETNSLTFIELAGGGATAFDLTEPGLAVGTGGYARRHSSNSPFVLRDRVAAIPVFVRVLGSSTGDGGTVRVQTRADSYIDLSFPFGATMAWNVEYGWLEVGINPDDTTRLIGQLFVLAATDASPQVTINAVTVHYAGGYSPAE